MEMRSCGTQPRKWKYRWEPYFRGTKWVFFIWTFQQSVTKLWLFSVTKLRLLLLVVQYRVCFYLEWRTNNLMILVIYPIWGGGNWSRWEECPPFSRSNLPLLFQITDSIILIRCLESTIEPSEKGNGYQFGSYMNTNLFPTVSITPIPEFCQQ